MHRKIIGQVVTLALSTLLSTGTFHSAFADDTEIFFGGQASNQVIAPNVLFVLDNSGSMSYPICDDYDSECHNDPDLAGKTRMEILQESFKTLMDSTRNMSINAGLLRFHNNNHKNTGQVIHHEVANLDSPSGTNPLLITSPDEGNGDATEQHENGQVDNDDVFVTVGKSGRESVEGYPLTIPHANQHIAREENGTTHIQRDNLRFYYGFLNAYHFEGLPIPAGATILSAHLELYAGTAHTWEASTNEVEITADTRIGRPLNISGRGQLSARLAHQVPESSRVDWRLGENRVGSSNWFQSPDIRSVIQAVVDSNSTDIDSLTFLFRELSDGSFLSTSNDTDPDKAPRLSVNYINNDPSATQTTYSAGFRFTNIDVPQGATITSATFRVTPDSSNSSTPTFIVRAEDTDSAQVFSETNGDISSRSLTSASATWQLAPWERTDINSNGDLNSYDVDVTHVVQEVVNRSDWCGGQAMALVLSPAPGSVGYRDIASEDSASPPPVLDIQVAPGTESSLGCQTKTLTYPITDRVNDVQTRHRVSGENVTKLTTYSLDLARADIGLRFNHFPLFQDADIQEAYLEFTAYDHIRHNPDLQISGHDVLNSPAFSEASDSLTSRTETSTKVDWALTGYWNSGKTFRSPDISGILEEIVAQDGWSPGSSLSLMIKPQQNYSNSQRIYAWDASPTRAPRLVIKLAANHFDPDAALPRVRDQLTSLVKDLRPGAGTPVLASLVRAQNYLAGSSTPINHTCQSNHIVLLSDGQPNTFYQADADDISNLTGETCVYSSNVAGQTTCARSLTEWMESNDMLASLDGTNTIVTHTIGYAADDYAEEFLKNIASPSSDQSDQKRYYEAKDAASLTAAFGSILQEILSIEASFNSASISVNQYRSYQHNNELYYALFTPNQKTNWTGNLKKYKLGTETETVNGEEVTSYFLVAEGGEKAVDPDTGSFKEGTSSFWSRARDGNRTDLGGAASRLPSPSSRNIYTDTDLNSSGTLANEPLRLNNASLTKARLGDSSMDDEERENIIQWGRGIHPDSGQSRQQIGDPLHSQPALVSYGCRTYLDPSDKSKGCDDDGEDLTLFFGTNQGFLHAISGHNGQEVFAYIPEELLPNLRQYYLDPVVGSGLHKPYGLDGSPVVWRIDNDKDGDIEPGDGDRVYLYFGMRRGGNNYYALDVTNRNSPRLLWKKDANSTGMGRLAQTWSKPTPTRILLNGVARRVLIFGGGYDPSNDISGAVRDADVSGNAVFIVDADSGAMLWRASSDTQSTLVLDKMDYSIPGEVIVLDLNLDGFGDQMIFADMGGQIWRLYIDQQQSNAGNTIVVRPFGGTGSTDARGVVANLSTNQASGNRRFYMRPVIGLTYAGNRQMFTIGIGSGYRAHPLDETVDDRFYVLKSESVFDNPVGVQTLTESDLYDATDNKVKVGNTSEREAAQNALALIPLNSDGSVQTDSNNVPLPPLANGGWYIRLVDDGEKALSDIALIDGYFSFATYEPATQANSCKAVQGINRYYRVNASDGSGVESQRKEIIQNTGIISSTRLVVVNEGELSGASSGANDLVTLEGIGTEYRETETGDAIRQTGWIDQKTQ